MLGIVDYQRLIYANISPQAKYFDNFSLPLDSESEAMAAIFVRDGVTARSQLELNRIVQSWNLTSDIAQGCR